MKSKPRQVGPEPSSPPASYPKPPFAGPSASSALSHLRTLPPVSLSARKTSCPLLDSCPSFKTGNSPALSGLLGCPRQFVLSPSPCSLGSLPSIPCTSHWGHWPTAISLQDPHSLPCTWLRAGHSVSVCEPSVWDWLLQESIEACVVGGQMDGWGLGMAGSWSAGRGGIEAD